MKLEDGEKKEETSAGTLLFLPPPLSLPLSLWNETSDSFYLVHHCDCENLECLHVMFA